MVFVKLDDLDIFKYEAFGLKIHSTIKLPELRLLESEKADITIYMGKVDLPFGSALDDGVNHLVTKNAIYRFWDEIGNFKIIKDTIIVDPAKGVNKSVLRNFILGTVFATLLRLRGLFVLHASSVNINGSAVVFSGFKGYGKSTIAMAFYNEGYPIVSDDYIALKFDNEFPLISPGFPSLRLSNNSRNAMGLNFDKSLNIMDKTYVSFPKSFSSDKLPIKKIYFLRRGKQSNIIDLKPQDSFIEMVKNTFGIHMFSKVDLPDNFFQCEKIVKNIDVSILELPDSLEKLHEAIKMVKEDIGDEL